MSELNTILESEYITRKSAIHDVHNTASTVATLTTTYAEYTNDGVDRNYSTEVMWDTVTNAVDCSMLAVGSKLDVVIDSRISSGNQNAIITVKFECPNGGSPFVLKESTVTIDKATTYSDEAAWKGYVGPEVKQYGVKIYSKVESGTLDLDQRKLLVRA